jgi:hypothetical protein
MRDARHPVATFVLSTLLAACALTDGAGDAANGRRVILHTTYVTGGDAPSVQSLIFFEDGAVRLKSVGTPPRWRRLSAKDRRRIVQLTNDAATRAAVAQLPRVFACCDAAEIAVSFENTTNELDSVRNPPSVPLHTLASMPVGVRRLLEERDRIGRSYFGRKYWTVLTRSRRTAAPNA